MHTTVHAESLTGLLCLIMIAKLWLDSRYSEEEPSEWSIWIGQKNSARAAEEGYFF